MKAVMKTITMALLCLIFYNCQQEEDISYDNSLQKEIQLWYAENHNDVMNRHDNFTGIPDWENFLQFNNKIYVPLTKQQLKKSNNAVKSNVNNTLFTKEFYVLEKVNGKYKESLDIFMSKNINDLNTFESTLKQSYASFTYAKDGRNVMFYNTQNISFVDNADNGTLEVLAKYTCDTIYVFATDHYSDGTSSSYYLYSYDICYSGGGSSDGGGGGGGSGGGGSMGDVLGDQGLIYEYAKCSSFQFEDVEGTDKIACGVYGVNATLNGKPAGEALYMLVTYNVPFNMYFTFPKNTSQHAANTVASIMHGAEKQTETFMKENPRMSPSEIKQYWHERIESGVRTAHGEVHYNNKHNVGVNKYETSIFGPGDCQ